MNINKNNYEAYFLDYHEGNLKPTEVAELLLFVEQHPELKNAFESFENFTIEDYSTITFENKADLKKEITDDNREEYFIRAVENTLNPIEKTLLENYIKQHPHCLNEYALYQKTKLLADTSIVFENKGALRKDLTPAFSAGAGNEGEALICYMEGLLNEEEIFALNKKINGDKQLQKELGLFKQTKLIADTSIVFKNKEALKRNERKIIPLYYSVSIAATVLLLIGLFFLFNTKTEQNFADKNKEVNKNNIVITPSKLLATTIEAESKVNPEVKSNSKRKKNTLRRKPIPQNNVVSNTIIKTDIINTETPVVKNEEQLIKKEEPLANVEQPITNTQQPAVEPEEFLSLKEIAVDKIKENVLDEKTLAAEKKSGKLHKLSGWDLAKVVAKAVSKLSGREVKVEPTYNDQGDVTAYALGAGAFEISRGK